MSKERKDLKILNRRLHALHVERKVTGPETQNARVKAKVSLKDSVDYASPNNTI